jgi:hypothetical protein
MSLDGISAGQEALGRLLLGCGPVSGVLEQTERLHEHMFVYQLLVLWWGVYWHSGSRECDSRDRAL